MNRKQFIALVLVVVAIGGAAWVYSHRQAEAWRSQNPKLGQKLLGDFQVNDVAQIRIQRGTNVLTLAKANGIWCVRQRDNYPANFRQISELLLKLRDLKIVQTVDVEPSQLAELNLAAPGPGTNSATLLVMSNSRGKPIRTLFLGKQHMQQSSQPSPDTMDNRWPDGRYVAVSKNSKTIEVISDPMNEVAPDADSWLDKTFLRIQNPKSVSVEFPAATNSWTLTRQSATNRWLLAGLKPGEKLDKLQASDTTESFSSPSFNDVAVDTNPQQTGLDKPTDVEIKTFDGFDYSLKIGRKTNDNYYLTVHTSATLPKEPAAIKGAKPGKQAAAGTAFQDNLRKLKDKLARESAFDKWVYCVPSWTITPLLKTRSQLLVAPPVASTNAPAAIHLPSARAKS